MVGRILFTVVMAVVGSWIHQWCNEDIIGGVYVSLIGVGFGFMMLLAVGCMIYVVKGKLDVFEDRSGPTHWFHEKSTWYPVACLIILLGMAGVGIWNKVDEQRPFKLENWTVAYHGTRQKDLRDTLIRFNSAPNREKILVLERSGERVTYSYMPYPPPRSFEHLRAGEIVQVRFQMGPLGFFRIYRIDAPEGGVSS